MTEPVGVDDLAEALDLGPHELVALVGGGGKSTSLLALGQQLTGRVLLTTTTKMGSAQTTELPTLTGPTDATVAESLTEASVTFVRGAHEGDKSVGVSTEQCDRWFDLADHIVVEADGARRRPYTAPRRFEPLVPSRTTTLVACIGSDALGRVIADQCHTPLRVAAVAGCSPYQRLTPARAARVLLDERGSRKSCPTAARFVVMVTKVDAAARPFCDELAEIVEPHVPVVFVAFDDRLVSEHAARR